MDYFSTLNILNSVLLFIICSLLIRQQKDGFMPLNFRGAKFIGWFLVYHFNSLLAENKTFINLKKKNKKKQVMNIKVHYICFSMLSAFLFIWTPSIIWYREPGSKRLYTHLHFPCVWWFVWARLNNIPCSFLLRPLCLTLSTK